MLNSLMNGALMPGVNNVAIPFQNASMVAPAPITPPAPPDAEPSLPDPDSLAGQFAARVPSGTTPAHVYLVNALARASGAGGGREGMFARAAQGEDFETQMRGDAAEQAQAAAAVVNDHLQQVDQSRFDGYLKRLDDLASHPPAPAAYVRPTAPTLAQVGLSLGAAALMPKFAAQSLAAPFQTQLRQASIDQGFADRQAQADARNWQGQIAATREGIDVLQRHDATLENIAARRENLNLRQQDRRDAAHAADRARYLHDLDNAAGTPGRLKAVFAEMDAAGHGDLVTPVMRQSLLSDAEAATQEKAAAAKRDKDEKIVQGYLRTGGDPNRLPSARLNDFVTARHMIAANDPDDPRLAQIDATMRAVSVPGQRQADQHDQAVASTRLANDRDATENATRSGKVRQLADAHDLAGVRVLAAQAQTQLAQDRHRWMDRDQAARIGQMEATAARARQTATDTAAGLNSRGRGSLTSLQSADLRYMSAIDHTTKEIASLHTQLQAVQAMETFSAVLGDASDHSHDADNLQALILARQTDLQRMTKYRDDNRARLDSMTQAPASGLPPASGVPGGASPMPDSAIQGAIGGGLPGGGSVRRLKSGRRVSY